MATCDPIQPAAAVQAVPSLSTDAITALPEEQSTTLRVRTCIRAGVGMDWQARSGALEADPGNA